MNIITITIQANTEAEFIERLDQIRDTVKSNTLEDHELMDGSYQVRDANIELLPV